MATVNGVLSAATADIQVVYFGGSWITSDDGDVYWGMMNSQPDFACLRFTLGAAIPDGATITTTAGSTAITFYGGEANMDEAYIHVTESADAALIADAANRPSWADTGATTTYPTTKTGTGVVHWTGTWPTSATVTIDVGPLVQHLVDTYDGLANAAHIVFWMCGAGADAESTFSAYNNEHMPTLLVTYEASAATSVTPEPAILTGTGDQVAPVISGAANFSPAILTGTGDQPAPTISGSAVHALNHIEQLTEVVDPTLDTTQNLGVGNYRSSTVTMNW